MPSKEESAAGRRSGDVSRPVVLAAGARPATFGWCRHAGMDGAVLGMETFGASAPIEKVQAKFGFEPGHVIQAAKKQLARWHPDWQ